MRLAVVVGFSIPGLAITRALGRAGHPVAIVHDGPVACPAARSKYVTSTHAFERTPTSLSATLIKLAQTEWQGMRPALFVTNDTDTGEIAAMLDELSELFAIAWAPSAEVVRQLLSKDGIAAFCSEHGIDHPASVVWHGEPLADGFQFPLIAKPVSPLSSFKTRRLASMEQLEVLQAEHANALPFLLQAFVPDDNARLLFCAIYAHEGKVVEHAEGEKLRSFPAPDGQGTAMMIAPNDALFQIAQQFVAAARFTGCICLEYKLDAAGKYWLIEPNVARSEFCIDAYIQSGMNIPLLEMSLIDRQSEPHVQRRHRRRVYWLDTVTEMAALGSLRWRPIFPYLSLDDPAPWFAAFRERLSSRFGARA